MANQPKGVAQTLTDVLGNLQTSLKERTRELEVAKKKLKEEMEARQALEEQIKTGKVDVGGEFVPKAEHEELVKTQKETQSALENAQAKLERDEANFRKASNDVERLRPLAEQKAVSRQKLDDAVAKAADR